MNIFLLNYNKFHYNIINIEKYNIFQINLIEFVLYSPRCSWPLYPYVSHNRHIYANTHNNMDNGTEMHRKLHVLPRHQTKNKIIIFLFALFSLKSTSLSTYCKRYVQPVKSAGSSLTALQYLSKSGSFLRSFSLSFSRSLSLSLLLPSLSFSRSLSLRFSLSLLSESTKG